MKYVALFLSLVSVSFARTEARAVRDCEGLLKAPLTYEAVKAFVGDPKNKITSIDALIPCLPKEYRDDYVLMFESESQQNASKRYPRVILFGGDASFIMAFSGDPTKPGFQHLEMIQWRKDEARFDFKEAVFKDGKGHFNDNPTRCVRCHRQDSRPNWEAYNVWKGAYFGIDNYIPKGTEEHKGYVDFHKNSAFKGRYEHLEELRHDVEKSRFRPVNPTDLTDTIRGSDGNRTFTASLFDHNRLRLARKLKEHPEYDRLKYAILGALLDCKDIESFIPEASRKAFPIPRTQFYDDTLKAMKEESDDRIRYSKKYAAAGGIIEYDYYERNKDLEQGRQLQAIVSLRYLMENRNMSSTDWTTSQNPKLFSFYDGTGPAFDWTSVPLAKEMLKAHPEFAKFYRFRPEYRFHPSYGARPDGYAYDKEMDGLKSARLSCALLKEKSLAALRDRPLQPPGASPSRRPLPGATGLRWREYLLENAHGY